MTRGDLRDQRDIWREVAERLSLDLDFPVTLAVENSELEPVVIVQQFGAKNGMAIFLKASELLERGDDLIRLGYGYSVVELDETSIHDPASICEMLNDWGFSGKQDARPKWISEGRCDP